MLSVQFQHTRSGAGPLLPHRKCHQPTSGALCNCGTSCAAAFQTVNFQCVGSGPAALPVHQKWAGSTSSMPEVGRRHFRCTRSGPAASLHARSGQSGYLLSTPIKIPWGQETHHYLPSTFLMAGRSFVNFRQFFMPPEDLPSTFRTAERPSVNLCKRFVQPEDPSTFCVAGRHSINFR